MKKCNKKAQTIFVSIMVGVMALILIVILASPLKQSIGEARNSSVNLNASDPDISIVNKATVIVLDLTLFYFIGILVAASLAYVTGKKSITGAITAIMVFMVVNILISPLKSLIILARDSTHLNCTGAAITIGNRLACIAVDIWLFYFVIAAISAGIAFIFIKGKQ